MIRINNNCSTLPSGAIWHLHKSLKWIHPLDLDGLDSIQLFERLPAPTINSPKWHKQARTEGYHIDGMYLSRDKNTSAQIQLFIEDIYRAIPGVFYWTPVPTLRIAQALAHEVGHHLLAHRGYMFSPDERIKYDKYEEELADQYAFSVLRKMRVHWWYLLGHWIIRKLASHYFIQGIACWEVKRYRKAAEHWYRAWVLDPDRKDAWDWYIQAKSHVRSQ